MEAFSWTEWGVRWVLLPLLIHTIQGLNLLKTAVLFIAKSFAAKTKDSVVRTPEDQFEGLHHLGYDFAPNYVELPVGGGKTLPRVHYVDAGPKDAKETILCLHGEPSWSFLYRKMVPVLTKAGYRVIAPDFIGFGKSDKYTHPERYTHDLHTLTLRLLLDHLKVTNVTLVCQDWGGLTGLTVLKDSPHLFARAVIMNTGVPDGMSFSQALREIPHMTPFLLWRSVVQFFEVYLPLGPLFYLSLPTATPEIIKAYTAPFPSPAHKAGAAQWPLLVPVTKKFLVAGEMRETREFLENKWKSPTLLMFSKDDPVTYHAKYEFQQLVPHAKTVDMAYGQHFLQEACGDQLALNVIKLIDGEL